MLYGSQTRHYPAAAPDVRVNERKILFRIPAFSPLPPNSIAEFSLLISNLDSSTDPNISETLKSDAILVVIMKPVFDSRG